MDAVNIQGSGPGQWCTCSRCMVRELSTITGGGGVKYSVDVKHVKHTENICALL